MPKILIADDKADGLGALRLLLKSERFQIETAASPAGVLKAVDSQEFDVVLIDLNYARDTTSGNEGLDLLTRIHAVDPTLPVVVMTAWGSVNLAVEAMRRGARDFIQKPWDNARLITVLRTQVELAEALRRGQRLEAENLALRDTVSERADDLPQIIAESPAMKSVLNLVDRIGRSDANVLITGENGTGKEVRPLAEHLLRLHRERCRRPVEGFTPEAVEGLRQHSWPGNVRELDHVIERAVLLTAGNTVSAFDLALGTSRDAAVSARLEELSLEEVERVLIRKALARFEG